MKGNWVWHLFGAKMLSAVKTSNAFTVILCKNFVDSIYYLGILVDSRKWRATQCTEVYFASFFSGGFITAIVVKPPERKLAKRTSVQCSENLFLSLTKFQNYTLFHFDGTDGISILILGGYNHFRNPVFISLMWGGGDFSTLVC